MKNDITDYINRDPNTFEYYLNDNWKENNIFNNFKNHIMSNKLNIPFVTQVLEKAFPFINSNIKKDIIDKSIEQGRCVHDMIHQSIIQRKDFKLKLAKTECNNSNHIYIAMRMITELNAMIYKHKITKILSERTFINKVDYLLIGTIDILMTNSKEWFLVDLKTSRINFLEKGAAQLSLYKEIIEKNNDIKISKMYILNPREELVVTTIDVCSKKDLYKIRSFINEF